MQSKVEPNREDPIAIAKEILDANVYMVLGMVDESSQPWVTPVYFSCAEYREFYWISSPDVRHPQVSIVVYNSQVAVGTGQAVYMSALAEELDGRPEHRKSVTL